MAVLKVDQIRKVVKSKKTRSAAIEALKLDESKLQGAIHAWVCWPHQEMHEAAHLVVQDKVSTELTKLLAVERELVMKYFGYDTKLTLYRGVTGDYAASIKKKLKARKTTKVPLRPAQSWTDNYHMAARFGDIVMKIEIPTSYIISSHKTNERLRRAHEYEYIVSFPEKAIKVTREQVTNVR